MSTRSIIVVTGKTIYDQPETIRIYKHSDGYPTANLPLIQKALKSSLDQVYAAQKRFKSSANRISVAQVVGHLIGAATTVYGMGANIDQDDNSQAIYDDSFRVHMLGCQCDLEWIYLINLNTKTVDVYGGGYSGDEPQKTHRKGRVDPLTYVNQLVEDVRKDEKQTISKSIADLKEIGFVVNKEKL